MEKITTKIICGDKISVEAVNQIIKNVIEGFVIQNTSEFIDVKKHILTQSEKITPGFVKLIQFCLDTNNKGSGRTSTTGITINYQLFKSELTEIMQNTTQVFFEFIYRAWSRVLIKLYEEAKEGNKKVCDLTLVLLGEISIAYDHVKDNTKARQKLEKSLELV